MHASALRALFSRLIIAAIAPLGTVACGGVALETLPAPERDGGEARDSAAPLPDASDPDAGDCTPLVAPVVCGATVTFPCGIIAGSNGTPLDPATCKAVCSSSGDLNGCSIYQSVSAGDSAFVACGQCSNGRRPAGLAPAGACVAKDAVGAWLAAVSHLEAASVPAFEELARALDEHGAPRKLVARARAAAKDEVRHARVTRDLARRRGASPPRVIVRPAKAASLARLAIENAVEGCVRETYGALVATWQAAKARDPEIAAAMNRIARDETRHAVLAWDIDLWITNRLPPADRERVERARDSATRTLIRDLEEEPIPDTVREAGLPPARIAKELAGSLARAMRAA